MTNEVLTTLKCCIDSIQLKLSDFGVEKPIFDKILSERFKPRRINKNINDSLILIADNHFELTNPICPKCNSKHVIKQEYRGRNPILGEYGQQRIYLRRYQCKECNKKFTTPLNSVIKPYYRYANVFKEKTKSLTQTGYRSLRKIVEDFNTFFGQTPSHQTIRNWLNINAKNRITNKNTVYSGYYCYDEQYLRIKGQRKFRLTLYDSILNIPIAEEIVPKRTPTAIKTFIQKSTIKQPLISITTDHFREYKNIIDDLRVKHQLCIFHLYKMIGDPVNKILRSKRISTKSKISLCLYFTEIKNIFRTYEGKIAIQRLEELLQKFNDIPKLLQKFITKKIIPDFQRLTHYTRDPLIPRTSNHVENYYRQTEPEQIKTKYKTNTGILTYLNLKMKNWTQKHGKKINTQ